MLASMTATARRVWRGWVRRPDLTCVVVAGGDRPVELAVAALRGSDAAWQLVVLAPAGGSAREAAERHSRTDRRVTVRDLGATAWWPGALAASRSARGRYVQVLGPLDEPVPDGLRRTAEAVLDRKADTAVGTVTGVGVAPGRTNLAERPELAGVALRPGQLVVERRLWMKATAGPAAASAPGAAVAAVLRAAERVHVVATPVLRERRPAAAGDVFGATDDASADLPAWLDELGATGTILAAGADPAARRAWLAGVLTREAPRYLDDAERLDDPGWARLSGWVAAAVGEVGREGLAAVPVESRAKAWLAARGERQAVVGLVAARRSENGQLATTTTTTTGDEAGPGEGHVHAVLPLLDRAPEWLTELAPTETTLRTSLRRLTWSGEESLALTVFAYVAGVDLRRAVPAVGVALVSDEGVTVPLAATLRADPEVTRWAGARHVNHDRGVVHTEVCVSDLPGPERDETTAWRLVVTVCVAGLRREGTVRSHDPAGSVSLLPDRAVRGRRVGVRVDGTGPCLVVRSGDADDASDGAGADRPDGPALLVEDFEVTDETWRLRGRWVSGPDRPGDGAVEVHGPQGPLRVSVAPAGSGRLEVVAPLTADPWGLGPRPMAGGWYQVRLPGGGAPRLAEQVAARLPETEMTAHHRAVTCLRDGALALRLAAPLRDDELGLYAQARLQEEYARCDQALDPTAVYLQAYDGRAATDSPAAIHDELRRRRPELRPTWAVREHAAWVPEGASVVLWQSRDWYAALARSTFVVTNIDLEAWFRRRPGQRVLQTFHGYPSKAMGRGLWQAKRHPPTKVEQLLDRTSRTWTMLLTPTPEMSRHYREQYAYDGPILDRGYPRDDLLVAGDTASVRTRTRERLGVRPDQTAVLYAPTWRDDAATGFRSAPLVDHLDVAEAANALGSDYVILLRGHRFHAAGRKSGRSRVVDVTAYPEINHLVLAADVAVLDYSSLRFDFALTERPMLFLVPDLDRYARDTRGFLFDFASSAPGPLLSSSPEVVEALLDLPQVAVRYADELRRFNERFNRYQDGRAASRVVEAFFGPGPGEAR